MVASAANANAPTITFTSDVFTTPKWTTAKIFDDFQSDATGLYADDRKTSVGNITFSGLNAVLKGASPLNASTSNRYVDMAYGSQFVVTPGANSKLQSLSFNIAVDAASQFRLDVYTYAGIYSFASNAIFGSDCNDAGQLTINQDGTSSISKVVFFSRGGETLVDNFAAAAPEPGTWLMMIVGFGAVGTALRRRRQVSPRVSFAG